MKRFLAVILFNLFAVTGVLANDVELEFHDVILKNVETKITLTSEEPIDSLWMNGNYLPVVHQDGKDDFVEIAVAAYDELKFESNVSYEAPKVVPGWLSLLPPLLAIVLALILKEVLTSLFIGIFAGAAVIGIYTKSFMGIFSAFYAVLDHYILDALADPDHLSVILFSVIIGSVVAVISKNGGMQGVVNRIVRFATTRKSGMLTTYFLGIAIFFDDYANTLVVGNTMRSVTDKLKISREKLAYIVDSTAAPIAAIAFITTWIGAELTYISGGVEKIEQTGAVIDESAYSIFVSSLGYSFYPIFTLFFMFFLLWKQKDFGPMLKFEKKAIKEGVDGGDDNDESTVDLSEFEPVNDSKVKAFNAIIPIAVIVVGTLVGLIYTGLESIVGEIASNENYNAGLSTWSQMNLLESAPDTFFRKLGTVIGSANSYTALLWASISGLAIAILLTVSQKIMNLHDTMESVMMGVKTMMSAVLILVLAWALAGVTEDLDTAGYLQSFFSEDFKMVWMIPAITFVLSAFIAFSTGSSWSTMALMYPLVIPMAYAVSAENLDYDAMAILYNTIASVLAGSVLGDHCSPISDTTILSSLASSCNHINHVKSQMPYALTVGSVALFIGIIPGALGLSSLISIPLGIVALYFIVHFFGKRAEAN